MTLSKLARIAVGVPVVATVAASLAWQIASDATRRARGVGGSNLGRVLRGG